MVFSLLFSSAAHAVVVMNEIAPGDENFEMKIAAVKVSGAKLRVSVEFNAPSAMVDRFSIAAVSIRPGHTGVTPLQEVGPVVKQRRNRAWFEFIIEERLLTRKDVCFVFFQPPPPGKTLEGEKVYFPGGTYHYAKLKRFLQEQK